MNGKYIFLVLISLIWGSQFIFNTLALESLPPFFISASRGIIGALTLIIFLFLFRKRLPNTNVYTKGYLALVFVIGIFETTLPLVLLTWGQQGTSSGMAAILIGTAPIFTTILVSIFIKSEKVHLGTIFSIVFGFAGLIVLFYPDLFAATQSSNHSLVYDLAILCAAFAFALSLVLMKALPVKSPTHGARDILIAAAIQLVLIHIVSGEALPKLSAFTTDAISSVLILGFFCAGIVYFLYMKLIKMAGATFTAITNYLVPIIGVALGVIFLGEALVLREVFALVIIIVGIIINEIISQKIHAKH